MTDFKFCLVVAYKTYLITEHPIPERETQNWILNEPISSGGSGKIRKKQLFPSMGEEKLGFWGSPNPNPKDHEEEEEAEEEEGSSAISRSPRSIFLNCCLWKTRNPPSTTWSATATARNASPTFSPRLSRSKFPCGAGGCSWWPSLLLG